MAYEEIVRPKTGIAGTAITKRRFVVLASDGQMDHVGTAGSIAPDGVSLEDQATVGREFAYAPANASTVQVECGAAVAVGGKVMSDNAGKVIPFDSTVGSICCGTVMADGATANATEIATIDFHITKMNVGT